jgi:hypothetical protein
MASSVAAQAWRSADAVVDDKKACIMSLDKLDVVDAVGTEKNSDTVVLNLLDEWDWDDERGHLFALQDKLNAYLAFVETGQIYEDYPTAAGKSLRIDIISRYPVPEAALAFLAKAATVASQLCISITQRHIGG